MIKYKCDECAKMVGENVVFITKWIGREKHFCSPECAIERFTEWVNECCGFEGHTKDCCTEKHRNCLDCKYENLGGSEEPCKTCSCNDKYCYYNEVK